MTARCSCACSPELRLLRDTVADLQRGLREVQSLLRERTAVPPTTPTRQQYDAVLAQLPGAVAGLVPAGARVLVVTRGDDRLLALDGRTGGHFPQAADGAYAGHHPLDSAQAIDELERMRAAGWRYLVFPVTALWWLDHYAELRRHLETTGRHFPCDPSGRYAGFHPADSAAAVRHLEEQQRSGATHLVLPSTALWWLDHYAGFAEHLRDRGDQLLDDTRHCRVYRLRDVA